MVLNKVFIDIFNKSKLPLQEFLDVTDLRYQRYHEWTNYKREIRFSTLKKIADTFEYEIEIKLI